MKRLHVALFSLFISLTGAAVAQTTLRLSHARPAMSTLDQDLRALATEVSKDVGVTLRLMPDGTLGDDATVERLVGEGAIDLSFQAVSSAKDPRFDIGVLPFFATDWADAKKKFGPGGAVRRAIEALHAQHGVKVLAAYPLYFGGIALQQNPAFVANKDIKVRVPQGKAAFAEAMGYTAFELPWSDTRQYFERGVIGGASGSGAEGYITDLLPHTIYYVVANTHFEVWYLLMNQRRFDSLSEAQRQGLQRAAVYFEARRWAKAETAQAFNELKLRNLGVVILRPTAAEAERTAAEVRKTVWPGIFEKIGREYAEKVLKGP